MRCYDEVFRNELPSSPKDPVSVVSLHLSRERYTRELAVILNLQKTGDAQIGRIDAALYLYDEKDRLIAGPVIYQYTQIPDGAETFGGEYRLELPDMEAVRAEAYIKEVVYADGRTWRNCNCPGEEVELFIEVNGEEETSEPSAAVRPAVGFAAAAAETQAAAVPAAEFTAEPAAKPAAEPVKKERKPLSKKAKKIIGFTGGGIAAAAAIALLTLFVVIPAIRYSKAGSLMDAGSFREAAEIYAVLEDYKDSMDRRNLSNALDQVAEGSFKSGIENALSRGFGAEIEYQTGGGKFTDKNGREKVSYVAGSSYEGLPEMARDFYTFDGWELAAVSYTETEGAYTANIALKAKYTPIEYPISYQELKDGTHGNPATYNVESPDIKLADASRKGYTFTGWSGDTLGGVQKDPVIKTGGHGELTFKANWEPNVYEVSLAGSGEKAKGGKAFKDQTVKVTFDKNYTLPEMEKDGFDFAGWTDGTETYLSGIWKKDSNVNVTPSFELHKFKLTYELNGGELDGTNPDTYTVEQPDITFSTAKRYGYDFVGWTWDTQTEPKNPAVLKKGSTGDKTVTAVWKGHEHTVKLDPNGGGLDKTSVTVTFGSEYSLPTPGKTGYSFQGWSSGKKNYSSGIWDEDEDVSVKASWAAKSFNVPLNYAGGSGGPASLAVTYDKAYSLPTPSRTGYDFTGWTIDGNPVSGGTWTIDGAPTITANWSPRTYTVTLDDNGGDLVNNRMTVTYGSSYTLPTPMKSGYSFQGWYNGYSSFSTSGTWNVAQDVTLTAKWKVAEYSIKMDLNGGRLTSGSTGKKVTYGGYYSLPTPRKTGAVFAGWTFDGEEFPSSGYYEYSKSITVTAEWDE